MPIGLYGMTIKLLERSQLPVPTSQILFCSVLLCYDIFYLFEMDIQNTLDETDAIVKSECSTSANFHHLSIGGISKLR